MSITLITGNQGKADQLAMWLGRKIPHTKLDVDEIQSVSVRDVVTHKVQQAYKLTGTPVLVEDVELSCTALGGLPGPLIKWFIKDDMSLLCRMLNSFNDRTALVRVMYALHDGKKIHYFEGTTKGSIALEPRGSGGFGWDALFIPDGTDQTRAEQNAGTYEKTSPRAKAIKQLKEFLHAQV